MSFRTLPAVAALLFAGPLAAQPAPAPRLTLAPTDPDTFRGRLRYGDDGGVAPIADLDGDGVTDLAVTAIGYVNNDDSPFLEGRVYVHSGATGAVLYTIDPTPERNEFSYNVAVGPDVDGDGTPDLAVGGVERVYLFSGVDGTELARYSESGLLFRAGVWVPDLDGDGREDLAYGVPDALNPTGTFTGGVRVLSGDGLGLLGAATLPDASGQARAGETIGLLGDTDGDGTPELAVSADEENSSATTDGGRVYRLELLPGLTEAPVLFAEGAAGVLFFGRQIAVLDDVNRDGVRDLGVVGQQGTSALATFVVSGASGAVLYTVQDPVVAPVGDVGIGNSLVGTDDLDGDGVGDLAVGDAASRQPDGTVASFFHVFSGASGALLRSVRDPEPRPNTQAGNLFPSDLHTVGDLDGDGRDEIAAASDADNGASGRVHVYSGAVLAPVADEPGAPALTVRVSPNPVRDVLRIASNAAGALAVADALGREVYRGALRGTADLDVRAWAPGVYLVRLVTPDGTASRAVTVVR